MEATETTLTETKKGFFSNFRATKAIITTGKVVGGAVVAVAAIIHIFVKL